jgi:hypothetical protein
MSSGGKVDVKITLREEWFMSCGGLFTDTYGGLFTNIADLFQKTRGVISQSEMLQMIGQRDQGGRTPLEIAW